MYRNMVCRLYVRLLRRRPYRVLLMRQRKTQAIAFSGIISALCVVLLYLGSIIEVLDYSVSALCGILVTLVTIEFGNRTGISVWIVSSVLALIILPVKFSALLFIAFCGWYSFLKKVLETLPKLISWVLKLICFNAVLSVIFFITLKILLVENIGFITVAATVVLSNFVFIIYDILLTKLTFLYIVSWRKRLTFLKK